MKEKGKQAHRPYHLTSLDNATHPRKSYVLSSKTVGVYLTVQPRGEIFLPFLELIPPPPTKKKFTEDNHSQNQKQNVEVK